MCVLPWRTPLKCWDRNGYMRFLVGENLPFEATGNQPQAGLQGEVE